MDTDERNTVTTKQIRDEQRAYYRLCDAAAALGVRVSLDDPRSPKTVQGLRDAIAAR